MKTTRIAALVFVATASAAALSMAAPKPAKPTIPPAIEAPVDPAYMWDLSEIYPSAEAWTAERDRVRAEIDALD